MTRHRESRPDRRVVITGLGAVAPGGIGIKAYWELLTAGRSATRTITHYDPSPFRSRVAAEVDFDPVREGLGPQEIRRLDRAAQFAVVAAREALADSGLAVAALDPGRIGTTLGSAVGCTTSEIATADTVFSAPAAPAAPKQASQPG